MNTGSVNGQDWDVIDFPRNQSACWESTADGTQRKGKEEEKNISLKKCQY